MRYTYSNAIRPFVPSFFAMPTCIALIVAAGRGNRFGGDLPKQYALLDGQPVLRRTLAVFQAVQGIDQSRVVIGPGDKPRYEAAVAGLDLPPPVEGGASRQHSVLNGLEALAGHPPDLVAIHDAARPYVRPEDIVACLEALASPDIDGAVLGVPLADTLKRADPGGAISETVPRAHLWRAQTPQVFRYAALLEAHRAVASLGANDATALTDDAAVAERAGLPGGMVAGPDDNRQLTTAQDLRQAPTMGTPP